MYLNFLKMSPGGPVGSKVKMFNKYLIAMANLKHKN